MTTTAELLGQVALFNLLDENERAVLAERVEVEQRPKGDVLFNYGDPGDALFIVSKGEVEMFFKNDTGERISLETAGPGDFFGELSLLDNGPRTTSAVVTKDAQLIVVDRGDLDELFRLKPPAALDLLAATGRRLRATNELLRHTASRNVNEELEDQRTTVMKIADWIAAFSGSLTFLAIHCVIFAVWIVLNLRLFSFGEFDPFPFGLLTMVVSLEAIILSVFVLLSQNRQVARERVRGDIEYDVNLKAELEISHVHEKLDTMNAELLARLAVIEKRGSVAPNGTA